MGRRTKGVNTPRPLIGMVQACWAACASRAGRPSRAGAVAAGEAKKLDHPFVGSGHLLLGLIREGEGIAAGILESLGVDMLALRDAVLDSFARGEMPLAET